MPRPTTSTRTDTLFPYTTLCRSRLGVRHVADHVVDVLSDGRGGIAAVRTREHGDIAAGLFVDCTGHAALLIGRHLGVEWIDRGDVLFNDRALAAQVDRKSTRLNSSH